LFDIQEALHMKFLTTLFAVVMLASGMAYAEDIVVIINPKNEAKLSKELVASYYMGDAKAWTGGIPIKLLDQPIDSSIRISFDKAVLGKTTHQMKELWMKNAMMGKAEPPQEVDNDAEVKKSVASSRLAMGYIKASSVDDTVKVAIKF
jgi:ABC-type phosphate transport system substrate-binding protein